MDTGMHKMDTYINHIQPINDNENQKYLDWDHGDYDTVDQWMF